jgi:hypothetical protein
MSMLKVLVTFVRGGSQYAIFHPWSQFQLLASLSRHFQKILRKKKLKRNVSKIKYFWIHANNKHRQQNLEKDLKK